MTGLTPHQEQDPSPHQHQHDKERGPCQRSFVLVGSRFDPRVLELLGRQPDQGVDLLGRVIPAGWVAFSDLPVPLAGVRESIERNTYPDEAPVCLFVPPLGLDLCPRLVDRIHRSRE